MNWKKIKRLLCIVIFFTPGIIWYQDTGNILQYYENTVPDGQLLYVLSKLFGLYALTGIAWQMISILINRLGFASENEFRLNHAIFGGINFFLVILHTGLFYFAVTLRQGKSAWQLFIPNFNDYYHIYLSAGLIGAMILITLVITGILRWYKKSSIVRYLHNSYWLLAGLVYIHALSIGTEAQSTIGLIYYSLLGNSIFFLWILLLLRRVRMRMIFP